jgi:anti-anti-sigma factor
MLKPSVQVHDENGIFLAEFWDCLRLDLGAVQDLRTKYEAHLKAGKRPEAIVDLLGVGFAGSSALGIFVGLQRLARSKNGRVIFCNVDPTVYEVFRVSKLDPLFSFVADRDAALALARRGDSETNGTNPAAEPGPPPARSTGGGALKGRRGRKLS